MAVLGRAAGAPDFHNTFIPELWVPEVQLQFEKASVFQDVSSNQYEGMIKNQGDTVNINIEPTVTVRDYVKHQNLESESPEPSTVVLEINKAKYFRIAIDSIDQAQSMPNLLSMYAQSGGRRMKEEIDKTVLQGIYNSENASNSGATAGADTSAFNMGVSGTPVALSASNIVNYLTDCSTVLDEQSVPEDGRWIILPPHIINLLLKSDLKDASMTGDSKSVALNGKYHRMIAGFTVYQSRQLYSVSDTYTCFYIPFGHKGALTFASQVTEARSIQNPNSFGWYVDALNCFGYKVIRDESLGILYAYRASA